MTSTYIDPTNFANERNVMNLPGGIRNRKQVATGALPKRFSDSTNPFSGVSSARKNRYQNNYVGVYPGSDKPGEALINKPALSYQTRKYEDDNVRFLDTGRRLRSVDGRGREFELSAKRVDRLNVFPDGTPRTGIVGDLMREQSSGSTIGKAVADFQTMLQQGIPLRMPAGMTPEQYNALLGGQLQSPGLQGMIFSEAQHKAAAEKEKAARQDEMKRIFGANVKINARALDELIALRDAGEITNDQLESLNQLTTKLANAKDAAERKQIEDDIRQSSIMKQVVRVEQRKKQELDNISQDLSSLFNELDKKQSVDFAGSKIEIETDAKGDETYIIRKPFAMNSAEDAIKFFIKESGKPSTMIMPDAVVGTMEAIQDVDVRGEPVDVNRRRAVLYWIMMKYQNDKKIPSYEIIKEFEKASKEITKFAKGGSASKGGKNERKIMLEDKYKEIIDNMNKVVVTPTKSGKKSA